MLELHAWPTPNSFKVAIFLEEAGLPFKTVPVDIGKGEQFQPGFLALSPNNRMPALVDTEGPGGAPISIFESGAILMYLGEKTGRFFPQEPRAKWATVQWLMWQMAGVGPMLGQLAHFGNYAKEKIPYAIERYTNEAKRLIGVLDRRLGEAEHVAGEYTIADMAIYPWLFGMVKRAPELAEGRANVERWMGALSARPAVAKGMDFMKEYRRTTPFTEEERKHLFERKPD